MIICLVDVAEGLTKELRSLPKVRGVGTIGFLNPLDAPTCYPEMI